MQRFVGLVIVLVAIFASATEVLASGKTIGVSWANLNQERWKTDESVLKSHITLAGNKYISSNASGSAEKQKADIELLRLQGAEILIIVPQDPMALLPTVKKLLSEGVSVIAYGTPIEDPGVLFVSFDQTAAGRLLASEMLKARDSGNYALVKGDPGDPSTTFVYDGMMEVLGPKIESGDIKIVAETSTDGWRPENAQKNMETILTANDNKIDAVLSGNDDVASGVIEALQAQGLDGQVPVTGQDGNRDALNRIAKGTQLASLFEDSRILALAASRAANSLAYGTKLEKIEGVEKLMVGREHFETNAILIDPTLITKDNLNVVIDAGWVDKTAVCQGVDDGSVPACKSLDPNPKLPVVDVCFASDRQLQSTNPRPVFSSGRATDLALGFARVSIPKDNHVFGELERPKENRFLMFSFGMQNEDAEKHFVIQSVEILSQDALVARANSILKISKLYKKHVFVFVHGFNVSFDDAIYTAAQISWDLNFDGLPCIYSWPSKAELSLTGYTYDTNSAQQTRSRLARFLQLLANLPEAEHVSIIAHSMGNLALIEALRQLPIPDAASPKPYSEIVLAAPDVDRDNFLSLAELLPKLADGVTLYASSNDKALLASKELAADVPRAGDVPFDGPVVVPRIDTIDASSVSSYIFGLNHSYFAADRSVVSDIGRLIRMRERPPIIRNTTFKVMTKQNGDSYWQFPR